MRTQSTGKKAFFASLFLAGAWSFGALATTKPAPKVKLGEESRKTVTNALMANQELHGHFFKYDGKSAEASAMKLRKAIEEVKDPEIAKLLSESKAKLTEIKAANDRKTNNESYSAVSTALIKVINKYEVGGGYSAYFCPMVKKQWIQNSVKMAKAQNPYSPDMPNCGAPVSVH